MDFKDYQLPKEYINKLSITKEDLKDFKEFWISELIALREMHNLSEEDISSIHSDLMNAFWIIKSKNK